MCGYCMQHMSDSPKGKSILPYRGLGFVHFGSLTFKNNHLFGTFALYLPTVKNFVQLDKLRVGLPILIRGMRN